MRRGCAQGRARYRGTGAARKIAAVGLAESKAGCLRGNN